MEDKAAWVQRVLGVTVASHDRAPSDDPLDIKNRLQYAGNDLKKFKDEGDPALPELLKAFGAAVKAHQANAPDIGDLLNALEEALSRAKQAAQYRQNKQDLAGKVDYAKLLLRWRRARDVAATNMSELAASLRSHPEVLNDPDADELLDLIDEMPELIPEFGSALDHVLDEAGKPGADVESLREEALDILGDYREEVLAVMEMKQLEDMAAMAGIGSYSMFSEFQAAFGELEKQLGG